MSIIWMNLCIKLLSLELINPEKYKVSQESIINYWISSKTNQKICVHLCTFVFICVQGEPCALFLRWKNILSFFFEKGKLNGKTFCQKARCLVFIFLWAYLWKSDFDNSNHLSHCFSYSIYSLVIFSQVF